MTFDSWLCGPLIEEDSRDHFDHPYRDTQTATGSIYSNVGGSGS